MYIFLQTIHRNNLDALPNPAYLPLNPLITPSRNSKSHPPRQNLQKLKIKLTTQKSLQPKFHPIPTNPPHPHHIKIAPNSPQPPTNHIRQLTWTVRLAVDYMNNYQRMPPDVGVSYLPLSHVAGLIAEIFVAI